MAYRHKKPTAARPAPELGAWCDEAISTHVDAACKRGKPGRAKLPARPKIDLAARLVDVGLADPPAGSSSSSEAKTPQGKKKKGGK